MCSACRSHRVRRSLAAALIALSAHAGVAEAAELPNRRCRIRNFQTRSGQTPNSQNRRRQIPAPNAAAAETASSPHAAAAAYRRRQNHWSPTAATHAAASRTPTCRWSGFGQKRIGRRENHSQGSCTESRESGIQHRLAISPSKGHRGRGHLTHYIYLAVLGIMRAKFSTGRGEFSLIRPIERQKPAAEDIPAADRPFCDPGATHASAHRFRDRFLAFSESREPVSSAVALRR